MAFRDRLLREFGDNMTVYKSDEAGRLDIKQLMSAASDDSIFYVCGPGGLIDAVVETAAELGIDPARIRFERFVATVAADQTMLEAGVESPYNCKAGNCKSCAVKVLDGEPDHRDSALSSAEREDYRLICPCVSRAKGDRLSLDI